MNDTGDGPCKTGVYEWLVEREGQRVQRQNTVEVRLLVSVVTGNDGRDGDGNEVGQNDGRVVRNNKFS